MFKIGEYVVYKRNVCKIKEIKEKHINNRDYYVLIPIDDETLTIDVPVDNKFIRNLISKDEIIKLINNMPNIPIIECTNKKIENDYRDLINSEKHTDLIRIIKTTYIRNKERLDNKKKIGDIDNNYFQKAEKYLYNEIGIVLGMNFDDTKKYIVDRVTELQK